MKVVMSFNVLKEVEIPDSFRGNCYHGLEWGDKFASMAREQGINFNAFDDAEINGVYDPDYEHDDWTEVIWED